MWTPGLGGGGEGRVLPAFSRPLQPPPLPPSKPITPAMFPFFWGFRGLPIWGSLDLHIPNRPVAPGVIALHPLHRP